MDLFWIVNIVLSCFLSILFAGVLIPQVLLISYRRRLFDELDERKIHRGVVPRLGGIAFKPVIFVVMALILGSTYVLGQNVILVNASKNISKLAFLYSSLMILYLVGIADDLVGVKFRAKFFAQIVCGILLVIGGVWIENLCGMFGVATLPYRFGAPLSIFFVVFIVNSINLIDGIDGLASGLSSVAFLSYVFAFFYLGEFFYAMMCAAALGVLIPFFYFNVFGDSNKRKKIFMGDTGSLTIGILLSFFSIELSSYCSISEIPDINFFIVAFSPLVVPCFDVVRVFILRVRNGKHPFKPDRSHIHHKLLNLGISQRWVMVLIIALSLFYVLLNMLLSQYYNSVLVLLVDVIIWILFNYFLSKYIKNISKTS